MMNNNKVLMKNTKEAYTKASLTIDRYISTYTTSGWEHAPVHTVTTIGYVGKWIKAHTPRQLGELVPTNGFDYLCVIKDSIERNSRPSYNAYFNRGFILNGVKYDYPTDSESLFNALSALGGQTVTVYLKNP